MDFIVASRLGLSHGQDFLEHTFFFFISFQSMALARHCRLGYKRNVLQRVHVLVAGHCEHYRPCRIVHTVISQ